MGFGWLFPLVIPIITIAIKREKYVDSTQHCFLNKEDGVIWAFIAPIIILLLINIVLLILAVIRIVTARFKSGEREKMVLLRNALIYSFILTPILGLPWVVLILNVFIVHTIVEWIFILVNGSMGVVFFLVVVLGNKEVREIFSKLKGKNQPNLHPAFRAQLIQSLVQSSGLIEELKPMTKKLIILNLFLVSYNC